MARASHRISIVVTNFDEVARMSNEAVFQNFVFCMRSSKKRILPKHVQFNRYRISRTPAAITVHLNLDENETAQISFVSAF
jgi:hypothetical protein